ncbi:dephospho-CoA kinase [Galactobacter caseinivorans]|uniref:Dephospho-CoA kinase n=1 Tax=Galactobacter caseinivorans TaxID=2676123 RepID=A0A496PKL0_9MICC|nr:dephospho-CoA kinase [Galactobacter caseinivorans]RKW71042.1 dephospho-CoA kinase [Galactobacter caseinivorans]
MSPTASPRPRIGLTGGIASGKSTVARLLAAKGAVIIDADAIVRELQQPGGAALAGIVSEFGEGMLAPDSTLDRAALGALVFGDDRARERLNAVVHPLVREEAARRIAAAPEGSTLVEDIPLLVETGQAGRFDRVVVVQASREERIRRMVSDRAMTPHDAAARIDAQATDAQRAEVATDVITNDADVEHLSAQVDAFWESLGRAE